MCIDILIHNESHIGKGTIDHVDSDFAGGSSMGEEIDILSVKLAQHSRTVHTAEGTVTETTKEMQAVLSPRSKV